MERKYFSNRGSLGKHFLQGKEKLSVTSYMFPGLLGKAKKF